MKNIFMYRPDRTYPLTGNEMVTIPHPLIMVLIFIQKLTSKLKMGMFIGCINCNKS